MYKPSDAVMQASYPEDGIFVHGLVMEGARWTDEEESAENVYSMPGGTACAGYLTESRLKQLLTPLPVVYVKAVQVKNDWSPEAVGYVRNDPQLYECPVYITSARGPTFVFLSTLKTLEPDAIR
jgi:dynein heavy chain